MSAPEAIAARLNEKWCCWISSLSPEAHAYVMANELYYFDEYVSGRMSLLAIVAEAQTKLIFA